MTIKLAQEEITKATQTEISAYDNAKAAIEQACKFLADEPQEVGKDVLYPHQDALIRLCTAEVPDEARENVALLALAVIKHVVDQGIVIHARGDLEVFESRVLTPMRRLAKKNSQKNDPQKKPLASVLNAYEDLVTHTVKAAATNSWALERIAWFALSSATQEEARVPLSHECRHIAGEHYSLLVKQRADKGEFGNATKTAQTLVALFAENNETIYHNVFAAAEAADEKGDTKNAIALVDCAIKYEMYHQYPFVRPTYKLLSSVADRSYQNLINDQSREPDEAQFQTSFKDMLSAGAVVRGNGISDISWVQKMLALEGVARDRGDYAVVEHSLLEAAGMLKSIGKKYWDGDLDILDTAVTNKIIDALSVLPVLDYPKEKDAKPVIASVYVSVGEKLLAHMAAKALETGKYVIAGFAGGMYYRRACKFAEAGLGKDAEDELDYFRKWRKVLPSTNSWNESLKQVDDDVTRLQKWFDGTRKEPLPHAQDMIDAINENMVRTSRSEVSRAATAAVGAALRALGKSPALG